MQPTLFLPHGAPDLALARIPAADFLKNAFQEIKRPSAIIIISAHWETTEIEITTASVLPTIYDFAGFSKELYTLKYPAHTAPWLISAISECLQDKGISVIHNANRGLDHGAWIPLRLAAPKGDIPVVQISLPRAYTPQMHFSLGQALSKLSEQNILVIGSGALVHNLYQIRREGTRAPQWALEFDQWVDQAISRQDWDALFNFDQTSIGRKAHPTPEHFLPLFVAAGAGAGYGGRLHSSKQHSSFSYGSISMSAWKFSREI